MTPEEKATFKVQHLTTQNYYLTKGDKNHGNN